MLGDSFRNALIKRFRGIEKTPLYLRYLVETLRCCAQIAVNKAT